MIVNLEQAILLLEQGQVVAIPTETVYGLAARIDRPHAIDAIFDTKSRPRKNPLIVHVDSMTQMQSFVRDDLPFVQDLMQAFWPGPLTLILPLKNSFEPSITAGLPTVAVRCPAHPICMELLSQTGPLVAPSANPSGRPSPCSAQHVLSDYAGRVPVLDGGVCQRGVESTIVFWQEVESKWVIARLGAVAPEDLYHILGYHPQRLGARQEAICPGQQWRHYAPKARLETLRTTQTSLLSYEAIIGFEERLYKTDAKCYLLGNSKDPHSCLQKLYSCLRQLDQDGIHVAAVDMEFSRQGLGSTLAERLEKAIGGSGD